MDWWMWVLAYVFMIALTGRLTYRYYNWVTNGYGAYRYGSNDRALLALLLGLIWPVMILFGAVLFGNTSKMEAEERRKMKASEKALEMREREARVARMERELLS